MVDYISPVLGTISDGVHRYVVYYKTINYASYADRIKKDFGYGRLRSGILWIETEFDEPREFIGAELNAYLLNKGFPWSVSSDLVRVFAANQTLVTDLAEKGFSVDDIVYGLDLKGRLKELGLVTRRVTTAFAFESTFTVYPIIKIPEYVPPPLPPPPEVLYRSQATFTYSSRRQGTKVELRIWYQYYELIEEQELIDKWNEANENAVNLTNEPLLDSMQPVGGDIQPGFELNHEISTSDVEGLLDTWYGKLIISRPGKQYVYEVL